MRVKEPRGPCGSGRRPLGEGCPPVYVRSCSVSRTRRGEETASFLPFCFTAGSGSTFSRHRPAELSSETLAELVLASLVPDIKQFKMSHYEAHGRLVLWGATNRGHADSSQLPHSASEQKTDRGQLLRTRTNDVPPGCACGIGRGKGCPEYESAPGPLSPGGGWGPHSQSKVTPPPRFPEPS